MLKNNDAIRKRYALKNSTLLLIWCNLRENQTVWWNVEIGKIDSSLNLCQVGCSEEGCPLNPEKYLQYSLNNWIKCRISDIIHKNSEKKVKNKFVCQFLFIVNNFELI